MGRTPQAAGDRVPPPRSYPPVPTDPEPHHRRRGAMLLTVALVLPVVIGNAVRSIPDPPDPTSGAVRHDLLWQDRHGLLDDRPLADHLEARWPDRQVVVGEDRQRVTLDITTLEPDVVEVRWSPPDDAPGRHPPDVVCFTRDGDGRIEATERPC